MTALEVMLKNTHTLFISDIHLEPSEAETSRLFLNFLSNQAIHADALYILGDLFEVWIGDDDTNSFIETIKKSLKNLTANKIPVYFIAGNRDFLLGSHFAKETGCQLLKDPTRIDLYGVPTLLMHGDSLCTADIRHQRFRRFSQNNFIKKLFLTTPLALRKKIANKIRNASKKRIGNMSAASMDVTSTAVKKIMEQYQVTKLIHGHTHQPKIHSLILNNTDGTRIVLGAWHEKGSVLICSSNGDTKLQNISRDALLERPSSANLQASQRHASTSDH